jgi:bacterioferritin-associated ferredoxin
MIVCLCHDITEEAILSAVLEGTLSELYEKSGMGSSCGSCLSEIRIIIEENYSEHTEDD